MLRKNYTICRLLCFVLFLNIFLTSCDKDSDPNPNKTVEEEPVKKPDGTDTTTDPDPDPDPATTEHSNQAISKKWVVNTNSGGRLSGAGDFSWLEFTVEGYYIVVTNEEETLTGTYTFVNGTITLNGLGVIKISELNETTFEFTYTANGSTDEISIQSTVADEIVAITSNTKLLCRTWSISRQYGKMYGMSYERSYPNDLVSQYTVVFSPYGTYLLSIDYSDGQKETINRVWRWKDSEESMICYGIESSECNDNNQTTIVSLTETNLTLKTVMAASETETNDILEIF